MKSRRNGDQWYFRMKAVGTDTQGRIHSVKVTPTNAHGSVIMPNCLHCQKEAIYSDKAYVSKTRKQAARAKGLAWRVLRKAAWKRRLHCADPSFSRKGNRTRTRGEHPFAVMKNLWGY